MKSLDSISSVFVSLAKREVMSEMDIEGHLFSSVRYGTLIF